MSRYSNFSESSHFFFAFINECEFTSFWHKINKFLQFSACRRMKTISSHWMTACSVRRVRRVVVDRLTSVPVRQHRARMVADCRWALVICPEVMCCASRMVLSVHRSVATQRKRQRKSHPVNYRAYFLRPNLRMRYEISY